MPRRARMSSAASRAALLDAVHTLSRDKGIDNVSVDEIACRAGLHKVAVYRLFGSRQALLLEYVLRHCNVLRDIFDEASGAQPDDARRQILHVFSRLSPGLIGRIQAMQTQCTRRNDAIAHLLDNESMSLREHLTKLCVGMNAREPDMLSFALFSVWQGVAFNAWTGAELPSPDALMKLIERLLNTYQGGEQPLT